VFYFTCNHGITHSARLGNLVPDSASTCKPTSTADQWLTKRKWAKCIDWFQSLRQDLEV